VQYQKRLNSLRLVSIVAVASQVEGIGASKVDESTVQLLTQALDNLAQEKIELARKLKRLGRCLEDKNSECDLLRQSKEDLQLRYASLSMVKLLFYCWTAVCDAANNVMNDSTLKNLAIKVPV